ncbi:uncharacterized protein BX664DRAFT_310472 [Halteromyces radiatus]|uniref:uncharacterized protein n=1 Tax=Halteromyces radiatus TaxID=101107 RepID=UPI002220426C|nr:uncharacterized protein BX664DRAFT_310472 [Halteromyces radiatus]KAI8099510.1 hypothetical protein BX664DRAFT_310472 [Halteromyces radiatus]
MDKKHQNDKDNTMLHLNTQQANTDDMGKPIQTGKAEPRRRSSVDSGISPTYMDDHGHIISTSPQGSSYGSPLYGDANRVYFSHHSTCICKGSGVGCDCSRTCSC